MSEFTSYVRFFHAASDTEPLQVSIDNTTFLPELSWRSVSNYGPVSGGFVSVTLAGVRSRRIYLQRTLPFFLPIKYTVAVIRTDNGLDLKQMADYAKNLEFEKAALLRDEIQRITDRKDLVD